MRKIFFMLLLLNLCNPFIILSQTVKGIKGGQFYTSSGYGFIRPCSQVGFKVFDYFVPAGYAQVDRFEWYYGSTLIHTETNPFESGLAAFTLNNPTATIGCRIYYRTASMPYSYTFQDATAFDPDFQISTVEFAVTPTSLVPGCTSTVTFTSSSPAPSGPFSDAYFLPTSYTVSYAPPAGWTQTSISGDGHTVSFTPSGSGTPLVATVLFPCGYTETKNVTIPYSFPAPTFSASNNYNVCTTPASYAIDGVCGATNYTYTINTSSGGISFSGGGTTLTTASTSVSINFTGSNSSGTLSVRANYPGGGTSNNIVNNITYGPQTPTYASAFLDHIIGRIKAIVNPVPTATSYRWYVNGTLKATTTVGNATIQTVRNDCGNSYLLEVEAITSCGTSARAPVLLSAPPCMMQFVISPNPASSQLVVDLNDTKQDIKTRRSPVTGIRGMRLTDKVGTILRQKRYPANTRRAVLDVTGLLSNQYFLHIYDGNNWTVQTVIVVK
jgi:hypothetical protein